MRTIKTCLFCQATDFETIVTRQDRLTNSIITFEYIQCQECGWISLTPQPSMYELVGFYPPHYESFLSIHTIDDFSRHIINEDKRKFQLITRHHPLPGFVLDIGCATGHFLDYMQRHNWKVMGLEPSPETAWQARRLYGVPVIAGELNSIRLQPYQFNVVTMWDVFEHLSNPITTLQLLHSSLVPDGLLLFTIPNVDSFDHKLFQRDWIGWDAPRHLHLCSLTIITTLLRQTGFKLLETHCLGGEYGSFILSLQTYLYGQTYFSQIKTWFHRFGMLTLRVGLLPYFWLSRSLKRSTTITVVAMKDKKL